MMPRWSAACVAPRNWRGCRPENPEFMPAIDKQAYKASNTYSAATAAITPEQRAKVAADSIAACRAKDLVAAGFLEDSAGFTAFANSKGNFGYQQQANMNYTCTVRTADGSGSGWVGRDVKDVSDFHVERDIDVAIRKARDSADAKALEPGKYTVILEPHAAAGLVSFMMSLLRCARGRRGPQLPVEEGRRQQAR